MNQTDAITCARDRDVAAAAILLNDVVGRFKLINLAPSLAAVRELGDVSTPLDVAVLGQFKSGKSSMLNALIGDELLPVGVLPVTAVVTRVSGGPRLIARVTYVDGRAMEIPVDAIADYVTESRNPENQRRVAYVDVESPALSGLSGLRLVDTPGLGSVLTHNTRSTLDWLPSVAIALVVVSAERPLSEEDRRLLANVQPHAPNIVIVLSKVDLLTPSQRDEVRGFMAGAASHHNGDPLAIHYFSTRADCERWISELRERVLEPVVRDRHGQRERTLRHKLSSLIDACRDYLLVALGSAQRTDAERERLLRAVLDETVREDIIRDELHLTAQRLLGATRTAFEGRFLPHRDGLQARVAEQLREELRSWRGHLGAQAGLFEEWLKVNLAGELTVLSGRVEPLAVDLVKEAEDRFSRILSAFRNRLSHNMSKALGISLSPMAWSGTARAPSGPPIRISRAFDMSIDMLWPIIPMWLFGRLFHRHFLRRVPWEIEKNLSRLASDWSDAVNAVISGFHRQSLEWARAELKTLAMLLEQRPGEVELIQRSLKELESLPMSAYRAGDSFARA